MNDVRTIRLDSSDAAIRAGGWDESGGGVLAFISCDAKSRVTTLVSRERRGSTRWSDPLEALSWIGRPNLIDDPFGDARWVGFLGFDLAREFERLPARIPPGDRDLPLFAFALVSPARSREPAAVLPQKSGSGQVLSSTFDRDAYVAAVARVIDYISAGDAFQVNLSQRFTLASDASPRRVYDRLLAAGGATYGALLQFRDYAIVSNSPELFLRVTPDRRVITRPIKGTRPRLPGMKEELLSSAKDAAELNMIIDLERNDLGRVCEIGTVKVTQPRTIEAHPTVYHGVATVEGVLREDVGFVNLLRATFPGGSVTGAPKIRAMEIIEELEPVRRGPYCGAIGYLAPDGSMQFNVAIRTMTFKDGLVDVPVGGGIVADSDPASEYQETLVKAKAMLEALGVSGEAGPR